MEIDNHFGSCQTLTVPSEQPRLYQLSPLFSTKSLVLEREEAQDLCQEFCEIKTCSSIVQFEYSEKWQKNVALKNIQDPILAANEIRALEALKEVAAEGGLPDLLEYYISPNASTSRIDGNAPSCQDQTILVFPTYKNINRKKMGLSLVRFLILLLIDLYQIACHFKDIIQILEKVHHAGWAHLDISPNNFMLNPESGKPILIDFGLAKKPGETHELGCGTSGYIAPEVYTSAITTSASDIYSIGILLGQMLEPYVPGISLHYLGSPLVRHTTTTFICNRIKEISSSRSNEHSWKPIIYIAADILFKMLQIDPSFRISASEILRHPFFTKSREHFEGFDYETHSKVLLLRSISEKSKKDALILYRG